MAVTSTTICNSALAKLGAERILSLNDDTARAIIMKEQYEKIRNELLYSHPWNFATGRVALALSVTPPLFDYGSSFPLPADCLRVYGCDLPQGEKWAVEGRNFLCDNDEVSIKYIKLITDESLFTPGFAEVFACKLAADLAYAITQNGTVETNAINKYTTKLREVRSFDAQEGAGDRVYSDGWLNARS